ncbi:MAG: cbb3-type cytochrome oxidase assembly protein CcoS [Phycisphaeraceae bacterium]|nr:MAG: cbb3-type cytochrome oxidase assembly protein CcoS [Phycisphaeraceae bacterium]
MEVMYVILPVAGVMALAAVVAFIRSTRSGQFDDLDTPPLRVLADDDDDARP